MTQQAKSFVAMTRGGKVVFTADNTASLHAHIARMRRRGVHLEAYEETRTLEPLGQVVPIRRKA